MNRLRSPSPIHFEPISPERSEILWHGSDSDEDSVGQAAKRRRIEDIAQRYRSGKPILITSARLRGPFNDVWPNPWRQDHRQKERRSSEDLKRRIKISADSAPRSLSKISVPRPDPTLERRLPSPLEVGPDNANGKGEGKAHTCPQQRSRQQDLFKQSKRQATESWLKSGMIPSSSNPDRARTPPPSPTAVLQDARGVARRQKRERAEKKAIRGGTNDKPVTRQFTPINAPKNSAQVGSTATRAELHPGRSYKSPEDTTYHPQESKQAKRRAGEQARHQAISPAMRSNVRIGQEKSVPSNSPKMDSKIDDAEDEQHDVLGNNGSDAARSILNPEVATKISDEPLKKSVALPPQAEPGAVCQSELPNELHPAMNPVSAPPILAETTPPAFGLAKTYLDPYTGSASHVTNLESPGTISSTPSRDAMLLSGNEAVWSPSAPPHDVSATKPSTIKERQTVSFPGTFSSPSNVIKYGKMGLDMETSPEPSLPSRPQSRKQAKSSLKSALKRSTYNTPAASTFSIFPNGDLEELTQEPAIFRGGDHVDAIVDEVGSFFEAWDLESELRRGL
ncbi:MAG: hypothetical protein M4579_005176 [Chaenotheca gracillima]|nr:MAG: hypothetical protein M4579_005176 [Chaenotheca gracillima]